MNNNGHNLWFRRALMVKCDITRIESRVDGSLPFCRSSDKLPRNAAGNIKISSNNIKIYQHISK